MRIVTSLALALVLAGSAGAQSFGRALYSTGTTSGETNDYISQFSWLGFMLESGRYLNDTWSGAFGLGWQVFHEETDDPVQIGNSGAAQGTQMRYLNIFPIMLQIQAHRANPRGGDVYLGLNAGTYYIEKRTDVSVISLLDDNWHLALAPQFGVQFPLGYGRGHGVIDVRYNYAFEADGVSYDWWTFSIGFAYGPRY